jgi:hypothetical protein
MQLKLLWLILLCLLLPQTFLWAQENAHGVTYYKEPHEDSDGKNHDGYSIHNTTSGSDITVEYEFTWYVSNLGHSKHQQDSISIPDGKVGQVWCQNPRDRALSLRIINVTRD